MTEHSPLTHALSRNPATGAVLQAYAFEDAAALEQALSRAAQGYAGWRRSPLEQRAAALRRLAVALREDSDALAGLITAEMGKPITQARAEVEKCAGLCDWYAEHGPRMLDREMTSVEQQRAWIEYRPLGSLLAVMPWNFPIWQVLRGAVPALLAGNTYVLKHAPNVMGSAYRLLQAFQRAEFPAGVFEVINVDNALVSAAIRDPRIAAVTVTGSVRAGSAIGAQAGAALKKCVLELGGSDAFIVLADADLDEAVRAAVIGRFQNTGQVCAAAKRFIVEDSIADIFTERFAAATRELLVGDPSQAQTYVGPMARFDLRDELHEQVQRTLAEGATLLLGGHKLDGDGNFYAPTVLADVTPDMTSFREELFGPVASIIRARDARHALELANDSDFGLAATVFSADLEVAHALAEELDVGGVFINGYCASDPRVGFGGVKKSGFGRELYHFGVREFCNAKTVWVDRR
ncbi:MAG: Succinate semialdehyde dehydrogenase [NAD(P)+] Sad [Pseudomonas citronellolis]|nr:MAG: Succinate semialdehyde dehydrogenase [NAD(P)+] Sad [Pseudomonas citronellolis]